MSTQPVECTSGNDTNDRPECERRMKNTRVEKSLSSGAKICSELIYHLSTTELLEWHEPNATKAGELTLIKPFTPKIKNTFSQPFKEKCIHNESW